MHLLSVAVVLALVAALAAVVYLLAGKVVAWRLIRAQLAGLACAVALTGWVSTARHAALVKSAATPLRNGQHLSAGFILACGFVFTFAVVTIAVLLASAVLGSRRARRAGAPAGRRGRRPAVRGW